jgi:phosphoribosylanthranilate isomerase
LKVKICGLTDIESAAAAAEAGADYLGLVFAPSRRQLTPSRAKLIADNIRQLKVRPLLVGVFVDAKPAEINTIADLCQLDTIQLSGKESWYQCGQIQRPIIKALHISPASNSAAISEEIEKGYSWIHPEKLIFLLDTRSKEGGGSGMTFDWGIASEISLRYPVLVAGGLNPQNVGRMLQLVNPWGIDVSSGVETDGQKDVKKIAEFIRAAKEIKDAGNNEK